LSHDLKKKNPNWSRTSVDDHDLTARTLFMEDNTDEEVLYEDFGLKGVEHNVSIIFKILFL